MRWSGRVQTFNLSYKIVRSLMCVSPQRPWQSLRNNDPRLPCVKWACQVKKATFTSQYSGLVTQDLLFHLIWRLLTWKRIIDTFWSVVTLLQCMWHVTLCDTCSVVYCLFCLWCSCVCVCVLLCYYVCKVEADVEYYSLSLASYHLSSFVNFAPLLNSTRRFWSAAVLTKTTKRR